MNRRLLLLRHAKSDWHTLTGGDHDRPLAARGRRAAATVGTWLAAVGRTPDLAVSSSAVRARSTVELASEAGGWNAPIEIREELYASSPSRVLEVVRGCATPNATILLAGHEPVWSDLASELVGGGRLRFPTAALASIRLSIADWTEIDFGRGELEWLITPKLLDRARRGEP